MPDDQVAQLIATVDELIELLRSEPGSNWSSHWSSWLQKVNKELRADDAHGIQRLLGAYGGMGSFNDVSLSDRKLAARFDRLRSTAFDLAHGMRND